MINLRVSKGKNGLAGGRMGDVLNYPTIPYYPLLSLPVPYNNR